MSLLIQCIYATKENGKLKYVRQCCESLMATVDLEKHRWIVIDNSCWKETNDYLQTLGAPIVVTMKENIGTARGINIGLRSREPEEYCVKTDDDLTWGKSGWVDEMERVMKSRPELGILGLKRDDVYGELIPDGEVLLNKDIIGTCTMFSPALMDKIGLMAQPSAWYGFDDVDYSVRSIAAGFVNAFLPSIPIVNLDEGGTEYTEWKKQEAGRYLSEAFARFELIKNGEISYYYDGSE